MPEAGAKIRVFFSCSGIGIMNRGIESFFREAFDGLKEIPGLDCHLFKGAGEPKPDETRLWNMSRQGWLAAAVGKLAGRSSYAVEQWSTFLPMARQIRKHRPQVIFYSDANLGFLLYRFRKQIGVPYRLLFSNGGPCHPPFLRTDFVQQVAPHYLAEALAAGEPAEKHFMVPYGIHVPPPPAATLDAKRAARAALGLPQDRPVVLSVGWVSRTHKRMDYTITEVAGLPQPRPFLQILGAMDEKSGEIVDLGNRLLGPRNFTAASVPYQKVADYYRAADVFVLSSLQEGFGRVYLEALAYGLPVIAHRHPVMEYVLGSEGIFGDLSKDGELSGLIPNALKVAEIDGSAHRRWQSVRDRFDWPVIAAAYREMFESAASRRLPG